MTPLALALASVLALGGLADCAAAAPPPDFLYGPAYHPADPRSPAEPSRATVTTTAAELAPDVIVPRRVLFRASTHALALEPPTLFFGNEAQNTLMTMPSDGSAIATVVGRPAPLEVAVDARAIAWIARPGNVVLRAPRAGAPPITLRDRGTFTAIAAGQGDVFLTEVLGEGGALTRITGPTSARLAALSSRPLAVRIDDASAFVLTRSEIVRVSRLGGKAERVAAGRGLAHLQLARESVVATASASPGRAVVSAPKLGGELVEIAQDARDAPIALFGETVYFFAEGEAEIREVPVSGGDIKVAARDEALDRVTALAVDELRLYVATERAGVLSLARPRPR